MSTSTPEQEWQAAHDGALTDGLTTEQAIELANDQTAWMFAAAAETQAAYDDLVAENDDLVLTPEYQTWLAGELDDRDGDAR